MSSTLPAVECTLQHTTLVTVKVHIAGAEVEAVVRTGASASVLEKHLARALGV